MGVLVVIAIVGILAVTGAMTGGSKKTITKNENKNTIYRDPDTNVKISLFGPIEPANSKEAKEAAELERIRKLIALDRMREGRLMNIRELNAKCIAEDGVPYRYEKAALEDFDDEHFKDYHALGVLPPSYRDGSRKRKALYR